jgi:hypothetical protein
MDVRPAAPTAHRHPPSASMTNPEVPHLDVEQLLTEPLTAGKIGHYFCIKRHRVPELIRGMNGAVVKFGTKYRLPLRLMPPRYLLAAQLLRAATVQWPESARPAKQTE